MLGNKSFITIFSQNIRSLNRNLDVFLCMFSPNTIPDVLIFSETWLALGDPVNIPGYTGFHTIRIGRSGGVSIFIKDSFLSEKIPELSFANDSIEICTIKIQNSSNILYLCGIYRPHAGTIENFCSSIESILSNNILANKSCIFTGDFNINLFNEDNNTNIFKDTMYSHHYLQTISDPTHPGDAPSNSSLIDHVWTNILSHHNTGIIRMGITDHHALFFSIPFVSEKSNGEKIKITYRNFNDENKLLFENSVATFNWGNLKSDDIHEYVNNFITKLNEIYQNAFPLCNKFVTYKYFQNPWHTNQIKKLTDVRKSYHNLLLQNLVTSSEYSRFRNKVTNIIRKHKETYYQRCFSKNFGNIKATWKNIRLLCNGYKNKKIQEITANGQIYNNSTEISEKFNEFFVNVATELDSNIPPTLDSPYAYVKSNTHPDLILDPITNEECALIINALKNSKQDVNTIPVSLFKSYSHHFIPTMCDMINQSFILGVFPDCLKHATVIPVYKKGDKKTLSNHRPISLLPFVSKIFERCIFNRLINYASMFNILTSQQYGFTRGRSTQDAILSLTERIYQCFESGHLCLNVFIDFKKCFDTINHIILLNKLDIYGIKGTPNNLIKDYLTRRTQCVRIDEAVSSALPITIGLPQGSILGPLLFLYFINDLPNISNIFNAILFADDTTLSFVSQSTNDLNTFCNIELDNFFKWTVANRLTINLGKNKTYSILHTYRNIDTNSVDIGINGNEIEIVNDGPFLGVNIDSKLKYSVHIDKMCSKISKSIGIIYRMKNLVPLPVMKQLYYSLIYPYLNYCICVYGGTYPIHLNRLFILQKRVIRLINNVPFLAHTDPLFFENKILKIYDMYKINIGIYMFDLPSGTYERTHEYNTRNRRDLLPNQIHLTICENSISVAGPKIWNSIPVEIKNSISRNVFKARYKHYLLSFYNS